MDKYSTTTYSWVKQFNSTGLTQIYTGSRAQTFTSGKSPRVNGKLVLRSNAFSLSRHEERCPLAMYSNGYAVQPPTVPPSYYPGNFYQSFRNFIADRNSVPQDVIDDAFSKFLSNTAQAKANLLVLYAERLKTVDMVTDRINKLARAAAAARRGNLTAAAMQLGYSAGSGASPKERGKRRRQQFASDWLELQYGWRPLLSDIYAICTARQPIGFDAYGSSVRSETIDEASSISLPFRIKRKHEVTYRCSVFARCTVTNSALRSAAEFGLIQPDLLAWELIPYSFIIDWFYPVSTYLQQMRALSGLSVSNGCTTHAIENTSLINYNPYGINGTTRLFASSGVSTRSSYRKARTLSIPSGVPSPRLKNPVSLIHFANALALLTKAFRF